MKINLDRLCKLAGLEGDAGMLSEASNRSMHDDASVSDEAEHRYGSNQLAEDADMYEDEHMDNMGEGMDDMDEDMGDMDEDEDMDEMIEVDEAMLVQEIRRARKMISESKKASPKSLAEQKLKKIVAEEVENVMKDLNLTAGWVYGNKKPVNSQRGVVNTAFAGPGFRDSK
tara:strand:- start:1111 stop:1623 length:513 start_codon:yes stop_codon:yes gene_type:complete